MTDERRRIFIRTLVRQVRYDARSGKVIVRFDNGPAPETTTDEASDQIEGKINED
jgi:hypothetical protein